MHIENEYYPYWDERNAEEAFKEYVNETYDEVKIMGVTFDPARILEALDEPAYRESFNNWLDAEMDSRTMSIWCITYPSGEEEFWYAEDEYEACELCGVPVNEDGYWVEQEPE